MGRGEGGSGDVGSTSPPRVSRLECGAWVQDGLPQWRVSDHVTNRAPDHKTKFDYVQLMQTSVNVVGKPPSPHEVDFMMSLRFASAATKRAFGL